MKLGLTPGCGEPIETVADLDRYLGLLAANNFSAVSLSSKEIEPVAADGDRGLAVVAAMLANHGLQCSDVLSLGIRSQARDELDSARALAHVANGLGAEMIHTTCFTMPTDPVLERIDRMADVVAEAGIKLALEFVPGVAVDSIPKAIEILNRIGRARMGIVIDTWHFFRGSSTWTDLETVDPADVILVQFNDAPPAISEDIMSESMNRRTWPGQGEFDLKRFADTLTKRGWNGVVAVEVLADDVRQLDAATYIRMAAETSRLYWPSLEEN